MWPVRGIGIFHQARADLKPECYSFCVVLFCHTHIIHRLSLYRMQQALKENSNDPALWLSIPRWGLQMKIRSLGGHIVGSDLWGGWGSTPKDSIPQGGGLHCRIYLTSMFISTIPREGHIRGSDPRGGGGGAHPRNGHPRGAPSK
jgi:hypothetical protein